MTPSPTPEQNEASSFADVDHRLSLSFGALILAMMLIVILVGGFYLKQVMEREEDRLGTILTEVLANSVSRVSFAGKYHARLLLEELKAAQPDIRYLLLAEPNGTVLAHSDPALNDSELSSESRATIRRVLQYGEHQSRHLQLDGELIHEVTLPYRGGYDNAVVGVIQVGLSQQQRTEAINSGILYITLLLLLLLGIGILITRRISAHFGRPIKALAEHNRLILNSAGEGIFGLNRNGIMTFVNPAAAAMLGYTPEELTGKPSHTTWHHHHCDGSDYPEHECPIHATLNSGSHHSGEEHFIRRGGHTFPVSYTSTPIIQHGEITGAVVSFSDITEKKEAEERINHLAYYDALTDLPNRTLLTERLTQALAGSRRHQRKGALLLINIDRFKNINDALGQAVGDRLLLALARRLESLLREGGTLARVAGDEFAILLPELGAHSTEASHNARKVAERIQRKIIQPVKVNDEEISCTVSLGITLFPEAEGESAEEVVRRADTALHRIKAAGGNQNAFFETNMGEAAEQRFRTEGELRLATGNNELRLYLQPQVDREGDLVGAEALLRWQHPERGLVPPGVFIPIAEESDLIVDLGNWVLSRAVELLVKCDMAGKPLRLSVNLSPRQFRQAGFVPWLKDLFASCGADPTHLTLEVTEGLVINDVAEVISKMSELTAMGIHFSVDDFGTGYSSLAYLKRLPIHELKIDKSFVQDAPSDDGSAALVETIIAVAEHMHLRVVAEGVETEEQAQFLNQRADLIHQGYLFGKPEPADDLIERWLKGEEA